MTFFSSVIPRISEQLRSFRRGLVAIVVVLLLISFSSAWASGAIARFWGDIQPSAGAQGYTELAFNDPNNLPTKVPSTGKIDFSFMLHNAEGKETSYSYVITLTADNHTQTVVNGHITLKAGARASIAESISSKTNAKSLEISVVLPVQRQTIGFWMVGPKR